MAEEEKGTVDVQAEDSREPRLYEIGYHLLPTVAEEEVGAEVSALKDRIEKHGGVIVADEMPKTVTLAYPIAFVPRLKRGAEIKKTYSSAHFGWIKFQMAPEAAVAFKKEIETEEKILRFLIIKTTLEKAAAPKKLSFLSSQKKETPKPAKPRAAPEKKVSEEELDKQIEELIVE